MLIQPRHDLDEVPGPVAVVELVQKDSSQASRQAPGEPGQQNLATSAPGPQRPAVARVWIAEVPIWHSSPIRNRVANPSMRFSNSGSSASGVASPG